MKQSLALLLGITIGFTFTACDTLYDPKTGHKIAQWSSDRTGFYYIGNGVQTGSSLALLSPVVAAHWHGATKLTGTVANGIVGLKALSAPGMVNTAAGAGSVLANAITARQPATPTPAPVPHLAHP